MTIAASITTLSWIVLGLIAAGTSDGNMKIHTRMTNAELHNIFNAEADAVPDYQVSRQRVRKSTNESSTLMRLTAFGKNVTLVLRPADAVLAGRNTPVWVLRSNLSDDNPCGRVEDAMRPIRRILEDRSKRALIHVRRLNSGHTVVSGYVGSENWVVKSLPDRLNDEIASRSRRSVRGSKKKSAGRAKFQYQVIYKSPKISRKPIYKSLRVPKNIFSDEIVRTKRSVPSTIYPELLVVVDYEIYKRHGENTDNILDYLLSFWYGVDLYYHAFENPKIKLNIAGIVIAGDAKVPVFGSIDNTNEVDEIVIGNFTQFVSDNRQCYPYDQYDIAVGMRACPPVLTNVTRSPLDSSMMRSAGVAFREGACKTTGNLTRATAVFEDCGAFRSMNVAAHELAHSLGARHDGERNYCSGAPYKIMSSIEGYTLDSFKWSWCTVHHFEEFFQKSQASCLFNKPNISSPLPIALPGLLLTPDEQCKAIRGTWACRLDASICSTLSCATYDLVVPCVRSVGAAAGTFCDWGKICLGGRCVSKANLL